MATISAGAGPSDSVDEALRARKQLSGPDPSMTVCADDGVAYQELVRAMDHVLAAGFIALDVSDAQR